MGKASSSKKVARAARTGGGRTTKGSSTSWFWPVFIGIVVVLGTTGIVYSKDQRQPDTTRPRQGKAGQAQDHWHAAIGFDICGTFAPNITDENDPTGIHTHGDGVAHIHPASPLSSGRRATLGVLFDATKAKMSSSQIGLPGRPAKRNGDKCGDTSGEVQVRTWPNRKPDTPGVPYTGNPADLRPQDGELNTVAVLPKETKTADTTPPGSPPPDSAQPTDSTQPPATSPDTSVPAAPAETPSPSVP